MTLCRSRQRLGVLLVLAAVAVPLAVASAAWACGVLATLSLTPRHTHVGAVVSGFGDNFSTSPKASAVLLRFNNRSGPVLWSGRPNSNGTIAPTFTVPNVRPGYYLADATQTGPTGAQAAGTPGRAVLLIGNPAPPRHGRSGAWPVASAPSPGGSGTGFSGLPGPDGTLVALLSAGLLAGGMGLLIGDRRRLQRSAPLL